MANGPMDRDAHEGGSLTLALWVSLSLALSLWHSSLPLSLSLCPALSLSLSLSRIKGVSGCSVGFYPPRGSNPPLRNRRGVLYPLYYKEMLSAL